MTNIAQTWLKNNNRRLKVGHALTI